MPKLPRVSGAEALRALEQLGFEKVRQSGSQFENIIPSRKATKDYLNQGESDAED
jgi:predicted RNA binding protein YcfA (HicA-like mRNA interferase family)